MVQWHEAVGCFHQQTRRLERGERGEQGSRKKRLIKGLNKVSCSGVAGMMGLMVLPRSIGWAICVESALIQTADQPFLGKLLGRKAAIIGVVYCSMGYVDMPTHTTKRSTTEMKLHLSCTTLWILALDRQEL